MICVDDFHKAFGDQVAVEGVGFVVEPGEIVGMIGPNGAGKTTTMRTLAGVLPPSRGRLRVAGFDVADQPVAAKSNLAFVPDDPPLLSDLTVAEHLAFYASVYDVADATRKAQELLDCFELADKSHVAASDLSRGMRQKLAICCAYLHEPPALLFDEPLTGLDPRAIRIFKRSLLDRAAAGAAVIISSHLLAMVEDICTRVLILAQGKQRFFGDLDALRAEFGAADPCVRLEDIFFAATATSDAINV